MTSTNSRQVTVVEAGKLAQITQLSPVQHLINDGRLTDAQCNYMLAAWTGCPVQDVELFFWTAERYQLNAAPANAQIFGVPRSQGKVLRLIVQIGINGLVAIAERGGRFGGLTAPEWCKAPKDPDGEPRWHQFWNFTDPKGKLLHPDAAKVGVGIRGVARPAFAVANWEESVTRNYDGSPQNLWATKPALMLAKTASALVIRRNFQDEFRGLVSDVEFSAELGDHRASVRDLYQGEERDRRIAERTSSATVIDVAPPAPRPQQPPPGAEPWLKYNAWTREHNVPTATVLAALDMAPATWVKEGKGSWDDALKLVQAAMAEPELPEGDVTTPSTEAHSLSADACPGCGAASWTGEFCESCGFSLSDVLPPASEQPEQASLLPTGSNAYPREERAKGGRR